MLVLIARKGSPSQALPKYAHAVARSQVWGAQTPYYGFHILIDSFYKLYNCILLYLSYLSSPQSHCAQCSAHRPAKMQDIKSPKFQTKRPPPPSPTSPLIWRERVSSSSPPPLVLAPSQSIPSITISHAPSFPSSPPPLSKVRLGTISSFRRCCHGPSF